MNFVDHSRSGRRRARSTVSGALLAFALAGCSHHASVARDTGSRDKLRVLHVCGNRGLRAATAIGGGECIALLEWSDADSGDLVIDGVPMVLTPKLKGIPTLPRLEQEARFPVPRIFHDNFQTGVGNTLCPHVSLVPGQSLTVTGYFLDATTASMPAFLSAEPVEVPAMVVPRVEPCRRPSDQHLIWLSVPLGDYSAFRGGPVAVAPPGRPRCVVAVVMFQSRRAPSAGEHRSILAALPIREIIP